MARSTFPTSARRTTFQCLVSPAAFACFLGAPLRQQGEFIGLLIARRTEVRPFTPAQIKLLETFADQAVIAIENVRLFQRTQGSLGAADRDERDPGRDCQLADGYPACAGRDCGECCGSVRPDASILRLSKTIVLRHRGHYGPCRCKRRIDRPLSRGTAGGERSLTSEKHTRR